MKTKIVYILVSSSDDIYLEQAYVSMYSVKYYMPDAHIFLLMDRQTEMSLTSVRSGGLKYVDEVISVDVEKDYSPQQRSRILKTSVRKYVEGDFLFIDTDTIVTKPLYKIDFMKSDLAACWDTHAPFLENPYRNMCIEHGKRLGWPIEKEKVYFNTGVIYVKDNEYTHKFYELWNMNWLEGCKKGVNMDQPSFAQTNYMFGHPVQTLDDVWNCELKHGIRFLKDAKIVHYLCTNVSKGDDKQIFVLNERRTFEDMLESDLEIPALVKEIVIDPFQGLSSVTQLFSGNDLLFFRSELFSLLYRFKDSLVFAGLDRLIKECKNMLKNVLRKR